MNAGYDRVDVLGTGISPIGIREVAGAIASPPDEGLTVAICNVHSVMSARGSTVLAAALADADIATADGMPIVWALRRFGVSDQERVTGIDTAARVIEDGLEAGLSHFFYGSTPAVLESLVANLKQRFPGIAIAGILSPPFHKLSDEELAAHLSTIRSSGANVVWVGLGLPKQELWMARARYGLPGTSLIGIGAAFDWMAGNVKRAPSWMQAVGLEWAYRLAREPRRLWRRYVFNNPMYLILLGLELVRRRLKDVGRRRRS